PRGPRLERHRCPSTTRSRDHCTHPERVRERCTTAPAGGKLLRMPEKDDIARALAAAHRNIEPTITRIVRLIGPREGDRSEPINLLEVNPATSPSGIWPIAFTPDPPEVPYGSVVVEVTPDEYSVIVGTALALPSGWTLGETLYEAAA